MTNPQLSPDDRAKFIKELEIINEHVLIDEVSRSQQLEHNLAISGALGNLLQILSADKNDYCLWQLDGYDGHHWEAECVGLWERERGDNPTADGYNFCPNCGKIPKLNKPLEN